MKKRLNVQSEIRRLDPKEDCQRIVFLTSFLEFPWDMTRALELALFRTFSIPTIADLLDRTQQFGKETQRRYDDTAIIINEIMVNGYDSKRGQSFIKRMNRIHGNYDISNDDFLYTLSTFVFEPIRWIDKFAWRKTYLNERLALFYFWREVGIKMRIKDIPDTYMEFEKFSQNYEDAMFSNVEVTQRIANPTRDLLLSFYLPRQLFKYGEPLVYAIMDDKLVKAMGYPEPGKMARTIAEGAMSARAKLLKVLPKNKSPKIDSLLQYRSHPDGYTVKDIGPKSMVEKWS